MALYWLYFSPSARNLLEECLKWKAYSSAVKLTSSCVGNLGFLLRFILLIGQVTEFGQAYVSLKIKVIGLPWWRSG